MNAKQLFKPRFALNKAFLKVKPSRDSIEKFKYNLINLLNSANSNESEEFHKNLLSDFLKQTYYSPEHFINTKGRNDLVIHNGKTAQTSVGVIIEAKRPGNSAEMPNATTGNFNVKSLQELVLYYLRERITNKNLELKHLIITNLREWYIFDAQLFEKLFASDKDLIKKFTDFEEKRLSSVKTDFFYKEIAEPTINAKANEIETTYFNFKDYEKPLRNNNKADDNQLIALFKLLSPEHLLKLPFANDSNTLDKSFYAELLHIIGLTETKDAGKKIIGRKNSGSRDDASLLENTINQLESLGKIERLSNYEQYGKSKEERLFNVALELVITWVNRVLFLKLLEAQLIAYHKGNKNFTFLSFAKIQNFDDLNSLFFQVLARRTEERSGEVHTNFGHVPYLNSSLFEVTDIEDKTVVISNLRDERQLPLFANTVLKNQAGKKEQGTKSTLEYLFSFLDAYDFSSEGSENIQEENKTLINASVLGLIFEKINGYKDGSFFTPGFITMYMCRETWRKAVIHKFNTLKGWSCDNFEELYNCIDDIKDANEIINSIRLCDPAVGSGHFLVSALNEMIAIKNDLKILIDRKGRRLKEYSVEVVNDELVVTDDNGSLFEYIPSSVESHRVQETLFHEKQTIIENCLFGVDINPNSVKICQLRLWIELLKNAYYKPGKNQFGHQELETLPNIDINIKCGNSLVHRFALDADLKPALQKSKFSIESYKVAVQTYRNAENKEQKWEMKRLIDTIKNDFESYFSINDARLKKLAKTRGELTALTTTKELFSTSKEDKKTKEWRKKVDKLTKEISQIEAQIEEVKSNHIYEHALEWRFEFPEVLDEEGNYLGFDVIIGNPPYIQLQKMGKDGENLQRMNYQAYEKTGDIYSLFYELGYNLLKTCGLLTFITSNKWMRAAYGESLRRFFAEQTNPLVLIDLGGVQIFDSATVDTNILMLEKDKNRQETKACSLKKEALINLSDYVRQNGTKSSFNSVENWIILNSIELGIKTKMEELGTSLKDWHINIYRGILTGYNDAFIITGDKRQEILSNCESQKEREKTDKIIRPILRGRDIGRYHHNFADLWLLFIPWHFPLHLDLSINGASEKAEIAFKLQYPSIYNHLLIYKNSLENRNKAETGIRYEWYALQRWGANYWEDFSKQKIVWGNLNLRGSYTLAPEGYFINAPCSMIVPGDKYLLGFLNSKLADYYIRKLGVTRNGGYFEYKPMFIEQLPIPKVSLEVKRKLESCVDFHLLGDKNYDDQIDHIIYSLYNLSPEEIQIIESSL